MWSFWSSYVQFWFIYVRCCLKEEYFLIYWFQSILVLYRSHMTALAQGLQKFVEPRCVLLRTQDLLLTWEYTESTAHAHNTTYIIVQPVVVIRCSCDDLRVIKPQSGSRTLRWCGSRCGTTPLLLCTVNLFGSDAALSTSVTIHPIIAQFLSVTSARHAFSLKKATNSLRRETDRFSAAAGEQLRARRANFFI